MVTFELIWLLFSNQETKMLELGTKDVFIAFLCNTQLASFTSHSNIKASQRTTSRQQTQRMMIQGTKLDTIPYFMCN